MRLSLFLILTALVLAGLVGIGSAAKPDGTHVRDDRRGTPHGDVVGGVEAGTGARRAPTLVQSG